MLTLWFVICYLYTYLETQEPDSTLKTCLLILSNEKSFLEKLSGKEEVPYKVPKYVYLYDLTKEH